MPINNTVKLCNARSKQNNHKPCRQPGMLTNGKCRLHGGKSTGPKTPEGKLRSAQANYKHGYYTNMAILERKLMRDEMKEWCDDLDDIRSFDQSI